MDDDQQRAVDVDPPSRVDRLMVLHCFSDAGWFYPSRTVTIPAASAAETLKKYYKRVDRLLQPLRPVGSHGYTLKP